MADDLARWRFWVHNPEVLLFPPEPDGPADPDTPPAPAWCAESRPFVEWGEFLLERLARDPDPKKIAWAERQLHRQYRQRYRRAEKDHRAEFNLDGHWCVFQAYLLIGDKIEEMELATGLPELEPPPMRIIDQPSPPPRRGPEINGILLGSREETDGL